MEREEKKEGGAQIYTPRVALAARDGLSEGEHFTVKRVDEEMNIYVHWRFDQTPNCSMKGGPWCTTARSGRALHGSDGKTPRSLRLRLISGLETR